jgi:hypothetical protein
MLNKTSFEQFASEDAAKFGICALLKQRGALLGQSPMQSVDPLGKSSHIMMPGVVWNRDKLYILFIVPDRSSYQWFVLRGKCYHDGSGCV